MHDDFEPISAIVERLVEAIAPDPGEETEPGAAHHDGEPRGGAGADVIWCDFSGCRPRPYMTEPAVVTVVTAMFPATGRGGNARRAKR